MKIALVDNPFIGTQVTHQSSKTLWADDRRLLTVSMANGHEMVACRNPIAEVTGVYDVSGGQPEARRELLTGI